MLRQRRRLVVILQLYFYSCKCHNVSKLATTIILCMFIYTQGNN